MYAYTYAYAYEVKSISIISSVHSAPYFSLGFHAQGVACKWAPGRKSFKGCLSTGLLIHSVCLYSRGALPILVVGS